MARALVGDPFCLVTRRATRVFGIDIFLIVSVMFHQIALKLIFSGWKVCPFTGDYARERPPFHLFHCSLFLLLAHKYNAHFIEYLLLVTKIIDVIEQE